ncbi:MAG: hypothetical protein ABIH21_01670, partial [Patescibacteria group bacterium]
MSPAFVFKNISVKYIQCCGYKYMLRLNKTSILKNLKVTAIFAVAGIFILGLFVAMPVLAQTDYLDQVGQATILAKTPLSVIIARLIRAFLGILGIIFVILVIYGGWSYMISRGDKIKVDKAVKILTNAVIGLLIILSSFIITTFIINA